MSKTTDTTDVEVVETAPVDKKKLAVQIAVTAASLVAVGVVTTLIAKKFGSSADNA